MHSRKDHLPEWKLAQFDGNPWRYVQGCTGISGAVAVFKSLSFNDDLKNFNLLSEAVS